jgi:hypothetical protein
MRTAVFSVVLSASLLIGGQAARAEPPMARTEEPDSQVEREFKEGFEKIFRALELMLRSVPQYAKPEVLENGDIVIRRKPPRPPAKQVPPSRDPEWT